MICQARGCVYDSMPESELCGYHDEISEDRPVARKNPVGRPRHTEAQKAAKAIANKAYRALHYDYNPVAVIKQQARDACREVLAEVKAKREKRVAR